LILVPVFYTVAGDLQRATARITGKATGARDSETDPPS